MPFHREALFLFHDCTGSKGDAGVRYRLPGIQLPLPSDERLDSAGGIRAISEGVHQQACEGLHMNHQSGAASVERYAIEQSAVVDRRDADQREIAPTVAALAADLQSFERRMPRQVAPLPLKDIALEEYLLPVIPGRGRDELHLVQQSLIRRVLVSRHLQVAHLAPATWSGVRRWKITSYACQLIAVFPGVFDAKAQRRKESQFAVSSRLHVSLFVKPLGLAHIARFRAVTGVDQRLLQHLFRQQQALKITGDVLTYVS